MVPSSAAALPDRFPGRATRWRLRTRALDLTGPPLLMGIVNVTPDSFSDGGRFRDCQAAVDHALRLVDAGASLLDIGGESTRPYSTPVEAQEELDRVLSVIERLVGRVRVPLSIDTSKAAVARAAVAAGTEVINDVSGLTGDPAMLPLAVETGAGLCVMHMRGTPQSMQDDPRYADVVAEIHAYLRERRDALVAAGIAPDRIALDPGIGFGKTHEHNLTLARHCHRFHDLGCPLLVGPSRKGFIGHVLGDKTADRDAGTAGVACSLAAQGVQIIRVHNVALVRQALLLFTATGET
jgi:dihydropteroate synthase